MMRYQRAQVGVGAMNRENGVVVSVVVGLGLSTELDVGGAGKEQRSHFWN